jgi:hypothetical protein
MKASLIRAIIFVSAAAGAYSGASDMNAREAHPADRTYARSSLVEPYEVLSPDASYCGPRILYFFARYTGHSCSLEDVVRLCEAREDGTTDLASLARAAEALNLDPVLIDCTSDQLLELRGPVVFCARPFSAPADADPIRDGQPVHFVGMVRREGEVVYVLDPSMLIGTIPVRREVVRRQFTGQAMLLGGCPRPVARPPWATWRNVLASIFAVAFLGGASAFIVRGTLRKMRTRKQASSRVANAD